MAAMPLSTVTIKLGASRLVNAVERRARKTVALVKAMRNKRRDIGAKPLTCVVPRSTDGST